MDMSGAGNEGVAQTSNMDTMPGQSKTYVIKPAKPAHVLPLPCSAAYPYPMGLQGIFVVEENRPNNWPQTLNVGAGQVRHPSVAVLENMLGI